MLRWCYSWRWEILVAVLSAVLLVSIVATECSMLMGVMNPAPGDMARSWKAVDATGEVYGQTIDVGQVGGALERLLRQSYRPGPVPPDVWNDLEALQTRLVSLEYDLRRFVIRLTTLAPTGVLQTPEVQPLETVYE